MSDIFDSWCFSTKNMIIIFVKSEASQASLGSEKLSSTNYPFKCGWMEMFEPSNSFINKYMTFNMHSQCWLLWCSSKLDSRQPGQAQKTQYGWLPQHSLTKSLSMLILLVFLQGSCMFLLWTFINPGGIKMSSQKSQVKPGNKE